MPRSLGGTDDPENLIRLTPEDHYFAHCCLAKIYGGTQWASVVMMGLSRKDGKRWHIRARYMYGAARRRYAQESSARQTGQPGRRGADNGMHDPTVHSWTNVDTGETRFATKSEMWLTVGGCRAHWTSAVSGVRKTMRGWTVNVDSVRVRSSKGKKFAFANDNGESFVGTQGEFAKHCGLSVASASRIARGLALSTSGWRVLERHAA